MKSFTSTFFVLLALAVSASVTMAASDNGTPPSGASAPRAAGFFAPPTPSHSKSPGLQRGSKIYFYSFDGTYLRTTAGTIYMPSVKLVNHSGEDLQKVDGTKEKLEVKLTVDNRRVRQVDVYPAGGQ